MELEVHLDVTKLDDDFALVVGSHAEETVEFFNERGLDGNGHTWAGIVESILRLEMPEMYDRIANCWSGSASAFGDTSPTKP